MRKEIKRETKVKRHMKKAAAVILTAMMCAALIPAAPGAADTAFAATGQSASDAAIEARAKSIVSKMTLYEKVNQMMIVKMPEKRIVDIAKKNQYGGYIMFGYNFQGVRKSTMIKRIRKCQKVSKRNMLIAVDEEGGTVVRASLYKNFRKSRFRSPRQIYRSSGYKGIVRDTKTKDKFLKGLGINCNFAPVADVPYRSSNFIYQRGFSTSAKKTLKFIKKTVTQMDKDDVVSCLKHFPGYGGNGDTHGQIIRDRRQLSTFKKRDLWPFRKGIDNGADMIMVSHVIVNAFDSKRPASLSKNVHKYLRKNLKFDGVIVTDGLGMEGIRKFVGGDAGKAAVYAIKAGNDMLCVTTGRIDTQRSIRNAVKKGKISEKQIDRSVQRIIEMKIRRGIIK